jgi:hypothetical protein
VEHILESLVRAFFEALLRDVPESIHRATVDWLLSTHDMTELVPRPMIANPNVQGLNHLLLLMSDALLVLAFMWACGRGMWERSFRARYTLKVVLPRILAAIALAHFSLLIGQMVIDLNNAMVSAVWSYRLPHGGSPFPWDPVFSTPGSNLISLALGAAVLVGLCILIVSYIVRFTVLAVLLVLAPLAACCLVLPETHTYARMWSRLFVSTVFMQFVQIVVLKLASAFLFDRQGTVIQALYGLATLYVLLKIPGALHTSSQLGTRVLRLAAHAEHSLQKLVMEDLKPAKVAAS